MFFLTNCTALGFKVLKIQYSIEDVPLQKGTSFSPLFLFVIGLK